MSVPAPRPEIARRSLAEAAAATGTFERAALFQGQAEIRLSDSLAGQPPGRGLRRRSVG